MDKLLLQLSHERSDWSLDVAGLRLTQSEKDYRQSWLDTVYVTLQLCALAAEGEAGLAAVAALRPWAPEDAWLYSIVERTLQGQATGEQQLAVMFDRAIATGGGRAGAACGRGGACIRALLGPHASFLRAGASGGAAAVRTTIAPSFIPISQLVLLTLKVRSELKGGLDSGPPP